MLVLRGASPSDGKCGITSRSFTVLCGKGGVLVGGGEVDAHGARRRGHSLKGNKYRGDEV